MTLQDIHQRAIVREHHRRAAVVVARADDDDDKDKSTTKLLPPPRTTNTTSKTSTGRSTSSTTTGTSTSTSTSASSSSSSSSTSKSSSSTSSSTSSVPTTITTPTTTTTQGRDLVITSSTTSTASPSQTSVAPPSTGLGTGGMIGAVGGGIAGIAVLAIIVAFIVRKLRNRRDRSGWDKDRFRRSAVMLSGDGQHGGSEKEGDGLLRPRPPSMIERKRANSPNPPGAAYPYRDVPSAAAPTPAASMYGDDQSYYGNTQPYYGGPSHAPGTYAQFDHGHSGFPAQAQFDQGHGAPPIPGAYGPGGYAAYGGSSDPRAGYAGAGGYGTVGGYGQPQQGHAHAGAGAYGQQQPQRQYSTRSASTVQRNGYGNHHEVQQTQYEHQASTRAPTITTSEAPNPISEKQAHALHLANPSESASATGTSSSAARLAPGPSSAQGDMSFTPTFLTRNTSQSSNSARSPTEAEAPPAYQPSLGYSNMKRDEKGRPAAETVTKEATQPEPAPKTGGAGERQRPISSYTLYDQDDAYGGM